MPVVRITALPQPKSVNVGDALQHLCTRLAELEGVEPRRWWATWQEVEPHAYVEGGVAAPSAQPRISHPPIVEILAFHGREPELIERLIATTAELLAADLQMDPGNVFVTWTDLQPGRVFTGGSIRR